ncbi:MAG TPA: hypothetical protein VGG29_01670 [Caulobacteraceae bacterium]|jgi:hypothetical protein
MGRWLILTAALAAPLAAQADPPQTEPAVSQPAPTYAVPPPAAPPGGASPGWGLHAAIGGRSMDLDRPSQGWGEDATLGRHDAEAGYTWSGHGASAVLGYAQFDMGPRRDPRLPGYDAPKETTSNVLGLSFVWRR